MKATLPRPQSQPQSPNGPDTSNIVMDACENGAYLPTNNISQQRDRAPKPCVSPFSNVTGPSREGHCSRPHTFSPISEGDESDYERFGQRKSALGSKEETGLLMRTPHSYTGREDITIELNELLLSPPDDSVLFRPAFVDEDPELIEDSEGHHPYCDELSRGVAQAPISGIGLGNIPRHGYNGFESTIDSHTGAFDRGDLSHMLPEHTRSTVVDRTNTEQLEDILFSLLDSRIWFGIVLAFLLICVSCITRTKDVATPSAPSREGHRPPTSMEILEDHDNEDNEDNENNEKDSTSSSNEDQDTLMVQVQEEVKPMPNKSRVSGTLPSRLWNAAESSSNGRCRFLTSGSLDDILTQESVKEELLRHADSKEPLATKIATLVCSKKEGSKSIRKIFAILAYVDRCSDIYLFLKAKIFDEDLPLVTSRNKASLVRPRRSRRELEPLADNANFTSWEPRQFEEFWSSQRVVLAPFFEEGEYNNIPHYTLDPDDVLPFTASNDPAEKVQYAGGYGRVYMARIHPQQHAFSDRSLAKRGFAIKEIEHHHYESFLKEREILQKFKGVHQDPHIVTLLATFDQHDKHSLIFYRAECDLVGFWQKQSPKPRFDKETVLWFAQQAAGMARGLSKLHKHRTWDREKVADPEGPKYPIKRSPSVESFDHLGGQRTTKYGRHGDIKGKNILWFHDPANPLGTLKFTDFGSSELNSRLSRSQYRDNVANTWNYRPPEIEYNHRAIRQSADLWSLGCVYLEFIAWLLGGFDLLLEFAKSRCSETAQDPARSYFDVKSDAFFATDICQKYKHGREKSIRVKQSVIEFFDAAHAHPNCSEFIHQFLNILQLEVLVLEPIDPALSIRIPCEHLVQRLQEYYNKCCADNTYATQARPWDLKPRNTGGHRNRCIVVPMGESPCIVGHEAVDVDQIMSALPSRGGEKPVGKKARGVTC